MADPSPVEGKKCERCPTLIPPNPSPGVTARQKYCPACALVVRREHVKRWKAAKKQAAGGEPNRCVNPDCGRVFAKAHGRQKYCQYSCSVRGQELAIERQRGRREADKQERLKAKEGHTHGTTGGQKLGAGGGGPEPAPPRIPGPSQRGPGESTPSLHGGEEPQDCGGQDAARPDKPGAGLPRTVQETRGVRVQPEPKPADGTGEVTAHQSRTYHNGAFVESPGTVPPADPAADPPAD